MRLLRSVFMITLVAFLLSGCQAISGGGWMYSAMVDMGGPDLVAPGQVPNGRDTPKATFGFEITCEPTGDNTAIVEGTVTYHDHGSTFVADNGKVKKLAFQGYIPPTEVIAISDYQPCDEPNYYVNWAGVYTPIPANAGEGGDMSFYAEDGGNTGPDKGDYLTVLLDGGILSGYSNSGTPGGGNIHLD